MRENFLTRTIVKIEAQLKFPNLKKNEIGIQVGFDLSSKNLTSDVLKMHSRVGKGGLVLAIDPDPLNHSRLQQVIERNKLSVKRVQKATYSEKTQNKLVLGTRAAYNKLEFIQSDESPAFTDEVIEVDMDTLDAIVADSGIDYSKIRHICITNNGAEYNTLLGMTDILNKCPNLNLTIASGRPDSMGDIDGRRDVEVIREFLEKNGFKTNFIRLNKSFWRGVVIYLILKRRWVFNKEAFGFIMASRGDRPLKAYQRLY